ncbi:hypothetical protein ABIB06_003255 [Bradyrhizobium sp. LB8.2]
MPAGRRFGRPEHGPHGDREQRAGQDRPDDEWFPHQAESVPQMNAPGRALRSCTANRGNPMNSFTGGNEPMPRQRIEPSCPAKTISKVSPTWAASMAAKPASPSRRRARIKASAMRMSWQSATPVKPIATRCRRNQNSASPAPHLHLEQQPRLSVVLIPRAEEIETEAGTCFGFIGTPPGRSSSAASCSPPSSPIPTPSSPRSGRPSRRSKPAPCEIS